METQLKHLKHDNTVAFVIGNGVSRANINLNSLKNYGIVYGCNAQYREYTPHYLVAVDVKMINEIISAGYHKHNSVWTNPNKGIVSKEYLNLFNPHKGWSSGPTALWLAAKHGHSEIYILGFDYQGVNGKFNNVYADTTNYKKSSETQTYYGNWLNQTETVIKENKKIIFKRVINSNSFIPDRLKSLPNFQHVDISEFTEKYSKSVNN
jgi:hypothetical protein